jgi:hypothetical protein
MGLLKLDDFLQIKKPASVLILQFVLFAHGFFVVGGSGASSRGHHDGMDSMSLMTLFVGEQTRSFGLWLFL